ncbi:MAG: hypothetical protein WC803_03795 [Sphingomonas sp.]
MIDTTFYLMLASTALAGLGMIAFTILTGWRGWLQLKHEELSTRGEAGSPLLPNTSTRIEIADLKERIRKLEAIAAGVDL